VSTMGFRDDKGGRPNSSANLIAVFRRVLLYCRVARNAGISLVIGSFDPGIRTSTFMFSSSIYHVRTRFGQQVDGIDLYQRGNDMTSSGNKYFYFKNLHENYYTIESFV